METILKFLIDRIGLPPIVVVVCVAVIGYFVYSDVISNHSKAIASLELRTDCIEKFVATQSEINTNMKRCHDETQQKLKDLADISQKNVDRIIDSIVNNRHRQPK